MTQTSDNPSWKLMQDRQIHSFAYVLDIDGQRYFIPLSQYMRPYTVIRSGIGRGLSHNPAIGYCGHEIDFDEAKQLVLEDLVELKTAGETPAAEVGF